MLRISVVNESGITRMKLEGKLAHEWVEEAKKAWAAMAGMSCETSLVVDLLSVSFVDDAGQRLLTEMRHAGAELLGSGLVMSALIDEIEEAEIATAEEPSIQGLTKQDQHN
jgi:anti-anti-sigma regulatory factor